MEAFSLFGISIYWYGIFYFLAFLFGYLFFLFLKKYTFLSSISKKFYTMLSQSPEDLILYAIFGVIIGGRLGHILIYGFPYYLSHPLEIFALWRGGMSFIGGILGVVVSMFFFGRKYSFSFYDFLVLTDFLILPTGFGIMLGRIGNFLNQELYGRLVSDVFPNISNTVLMYLSRIHIFYVYDQVDPFLRINTNFLSSFFEGFVVFLFSLWSISSSLKKEKRHVGYLSSLFLIWYSLIRFIFEYLRMDSQSEYILMFTKSQWFFLLFFLIGIILFIRSFRKSYMK